MPLNVPRYQKKDIIAFASDFYSQYNRVAGNVYLVDEAIELGLGMDISPESGLYSKYDVDAFTTGDFRRIVIDDSLMGRSYGRYRFTLAHEVGHYVLHKDILKTTDINTVNDWIEFHRSLNDADHKEMERQCDIFASHLLMPIAKINPFLDEKFTQMKTDIDHLRGCGVPMDGINGIKSYMQNKLAREISSSFDVSVEAAEIRVKDNYRLLRAFAQYHR